MYRHVLTDQEWNAIRVFLPAERNGKRGRPWKDHRLVISGILWVIRVGCAWRDLPGHFGKWQTVYKRFNRWRREGLWDRVWEKILKRFDSKQLISRDLWCVDSSVIRAHRCAAGGSIKHRKNPNENGLGRSKGGYSTKVHLMCDQNGIPLGVTVTAGERGEAPEFPNVFQSTPLSIHQWSKRPYAIAGDKAYSSQAIRDQVRKKGIRPVIPTRTNQTPEKDFSKRIYRDRNIVERLIGRLKEFRRIATRYDKTIDNFVATIKIACCRIILKSI